MERANARCHRARAQHDLRLRSFRRAFDRFAVEAAERELASVAVDDEAPAGATQTVKAGQIIDYMEGGIGGASNLKGLILQRPLQAYLNKVFTSEGDATKFVELALSAPAGGPAPSPNSPLQDALKTSCSRNLDIMTGVLGRPVVRSHAGALSSYDDQLWSGVEWGRAD
eukprot:427412-Pyramimonas_sp.AAC.1